MIVAGVSATTALTGLSAFAGTAHAASNPTVDRQGGQDRFGTSALIAESQYPNGVPGGNVILATGYNYPDALAGAFLAGAQGAPVLLVPTSTSDPYYSETTAALAKLLPGSTKKVTILGGSAAVGNDVQTDLTNKGYTVSRIFGNTRYDTMQAIDTASGTTVGNGQSGNKTCIVANGENFPDALSGGPLAFAKHFPIVLTNGTQQTLNSQASATIAADGCKNFIVLGGSAAVSQGIVTQLGTMGTVDKVVAGQDRSDTAAQLAAYEIATYGFSNAANVILASGQTFPDALSSGPWGGNLTAAILLTELDGSLGQYSTAAFAKYGWQTIHIAGGSAAVSTSAQQQAVTADQSAAAQTGVVSLNSSSANQGGTVTGSVGNPSQVQSLTVTGCGLTNQAISGYNPGPFSITIPATQSAGSCTLTFTATPSGGGTPVTTNVPFTVNSTSTGGQVAQPQLSSASILKTVTAAQATTSLPAGTYVQYVFTQNISGASVSKTGFHVFDAADNRYDAVSASVDTSNPNAVDAYYNEAAPTVAAAGGAGGAGSDLTTTAGAANLTLATVGGPQDVGGAAVTAPTGASPDGSSPIGTAQTTGAAAAGVTTAPNPESWNITQAGGASPAYPTSTAINVTFDKTVYTQKAATAYPNTPVGGVAAQAAPGFNIVLTATNAAGNEVACFGPQTGDTTASGGTIPGGNGTTTLTIICPNPGNSSTPIAASGIGRVVVQQGAVGTAAQSTGKAVVNPLEIADSPDNTTDTPDLTSAAFIPGTGSTADTIVYTYDKAVSAAPDATKYGFYTSGALQVNCVANALGTNAVAATNTTPGSAPCVATRNTNNFDQVIVTVGTTGVTGAAPTGSGETANATGAISMKQAVTNANPTAGVNLPSGDDEYGAANPNNAGTAITPGTVNAPQLQSVHVGSTTNALGTSYYVVYTFSEPVNNPTAAPIVTSPGSLHLYDKDGTELSCTAATVGTGANTNQVTCTQANIVQGSSAGTTQATVAQLTSAVFGTSDFGAVTGGAATPSGATNPGAGNVNPEGGVATS